MIKNKILRKKHLVILSCIFTAGLFSFSCASAKTASGDDAVNAESPVTEEVVETAAAEVSQTAVSETAVEPEEEASAETTEEVKSDEKKSKKKTKKSSKSDKKNYTGWIDSSGRPIDATFGSIRFKVRPKTGTFNILVVNENNKSIPVLTTANEYSTSSFYLLSGKKIIKLNEDVNVKTSARKTSDGVQIKYVIEKNAEVLIDFKTFKATETGDIDTIKVTGSIKNLGKKKKDLALKVIFDTILGETDRHHFYDLNNVAVKSEIALRNMDQAKWFVSKNENAAMQIILSGKDCTAPALTALANYATLDTTGWEPDMLSYRTFDTVLSYNNSAVGIVWQTRSISPEEESKDICYLSFGTDGDMPLGSQWIEKVEESASVTEKAVTVEKEKTPAVEKIPAVDDTAKPQNIEPKIEKPAEEKKPAQKIDAYTPDTSVPFDINKITKEQMSTEYIQQLLNKIAALEDSGESVNKAELMKLNAELDAILELLRN